MKTTRPAHPAMTGLTAAACICASTLSMPAQAADPPPATIIVLKAAHVFDSTGTSLRNGATVVVTGDKIVSVGNGPIPAGAKVIDLGDATILPGFIDAHVHLTDELLNNYYKGFYDSMFRFPAEQAHYAELYAKRTLEAGFTTVRNVGADEFLDEHGSFLTENAQPGRALRSGGQARSSAPRV